MIETRAREVIGAEVDDDRMTWRKGCNKDGISKNRMSEDLLVGDAFACHGPKGWITYLYNDLYLLLTLQTRI